MGAALSRRAEAAEARRKRSEAAAIATLHRDLLDGAARPEVDITVGGVPMTFTQAPCMFDTGLKVYASPTERVQ